MLTKMNLIEKGNIPSIESVCFPTAPFIMLRYSALADFYTEEPRYILARYSNNIDLSFEQILRIRLWIPNRRTSSWLIYATSRDVTDTNSLSNGIFLRHILWDKRQDITLIRSKRDINSTENQYPRMMAETLHILPSDHITLIEKMIALDKTIKSGISLEEKEAALNIPWSDMEVYRMYDAGYWGVNFSLNQRNLCLEKKVQELIAYLHRTKRTSRYSENIKSIQLNYSYPIESYKNHIWGANL